MKSILKTNNIFLIIIIPFVLICVSNPAITDGLVLLENKHPLYWKLFGLYEPFSVVVIPEYKNIPEEMMSKSIPNVLNEYEWLDNYNTEVEIHKEKDFLILDGKADETFYPDITKDRLMLPTGTYYAFSGYLHPEVITYIEGFKGEKNRPILWDFSNGIFSTDNDRYTNGYKYTIKIKGDEVLRHIKITPRIIKISNYQDDDSKIKQIKAWRINRSNWENLHGFDYLLAKRRMKYHYADSEWTSVFFEDETGIQYVGGKLKEGRINSFGVVID